MTSAFSRHRLSYRLVVDDDNGDDEVTVSSIVRRDDDSDDDDGNDDNDDDFRFGDKGENFAGLSTLIVSTSGLVTTSITRDL